MLECALRAVIEREGLADVMASQLAHKAAEGDLRALGMVIDLLGEAGGEGETLRVELSPEVWELAK